MLVLGSVLQIGSEIPIQSAFPDRDFTSMGSAPLPGYITLLFYTSAAGFQIFILAVPTAIRAYWKNNGLFAVLLGIFLFNPWVLAFIAIDFVWREFSGLFMV